MNDFEKSIQYVKDGNIESLQKHINEGKYHEKDVLVDIAVRMNDLSIVKLLNSYGEYHWNKHDCDNASNLEMLGYLNKIGCPLTSWTFRCAQSIEILEWLHYKDCPYESDIYDDQAKSGNLKNLKWLYSKGYMGKSSANARAAYEGHVDVLKWLHSIGIKSDKKTIIYAKLGKREKVLEMFNRSDICSALKYIP